MRCPKCGAPMAVERVFHVGSSTWRERRCRAANCRFSLVTEERQGDPRTYCRLRARRVSTRRAQKPNAPRESLGAGNSEL